MSRNKKAITKELISRGFSEPIELFYWPNDGWYVQCNEMRHMHIGYNAADVLRQIKKGIFNRYLS